MSSGFEVRGAEDWRRLARSLKASDAPIRRHVRKGLRDVAKPLGIDMRDAGAAAMPKRGGLSARVARSTVSLRTAGGMGAGARIEIALRTKEGYDLSGMDAGLIRHPVFDTGAWVSQAVPAKSFSNAFDRGAPKVRAALIREIDQALDEIAES